MHIYTSSADGAVGRAQASAVIAHSMLSRPAAPSRSLKESDGVGKASIVKTMNSVKEAKIPGQGNRPAEATLAELDGRPVVAEKVHAHP